mmetsp:Transcript_18022/g.27922  ORF Transcript_18022/g.27922 Transcript_18022/m.27922 type:complete len:90 (-) Transcript_18022:1280-1549(-)
MESDCIDEFNVRNLFAIRFSSELGKSTDKRGQEVSNSSSMRYPPKLIRFVFHDAIDWNNLVDKNFNNVPSEKLGGVDFCLHTDIVDNKG